MSLGEFATIKPMVEPRAPADEVAVLRANLQKNIETLTESSDRTEINAAILAEYSKQSFAMLDTAEYTAAGMERFLSRYSMLTHNVETLLMLHASCDVIKNRLLDVIDVLRGIVVAPDRESIKAENIGFLTDNLAKLNACLDLPGLTFDYAKHYTALNLCLEYHAGRGRIYNMVTSSETQVNQAKQASA
jgi:hypothetical protein